MKQAASFSLEPSNCLAPFVLFTGGKGGVGKTTLAANLAVRLAQNGLRVLLVDLGAQCLANVNVMFRLTPNRTIEDALNGECSFRDLIVEGPSGIHVVPAGSGTADMGRPDELRRERILDEIRQLSSDYDVVLGDSAAGIGTDVLAFAKAADRVYVVTTPQPAALTDAYGLIKALDTWAISDGGEIPTPELLLNQVESLTEARAVARRLSSVCESFLSRSPRFAGWMPWASAVVESASTQKPFAGSERKTLEARCLTLLAERVSRLAHTEEGALAR